VCSVLDLDEIGVPEAIPEVNVLLGYFFFALVVLYRDDHRVWAPCRSFGDIFSNRLPYKPIEAEWDFVATSQGLGINGNHERRSLFDQILD